MKLQVKHNSAVSFQSVLRTDEIAQGVDYKFIFNAPGLIPPTSVGTASSVDLVVAVC